MKTIPGHTDPPGDQSSDQMFDALVSATATKSKVDSEWIKSTIYTLRQNGCEEVTGNKLADRWINKYHVTQVLEGMTIKQSLALLLPPDAEDFCNWLQNLEGKYPKN